MEYPAIAKAQSEAEAADRRHHRVRRSDGSGTTFNFTDYLSKASGDWKSKVGSGTAVEWPAASAPRAMRRCRQHQQTKNSTVTSSMLCQAETADLRGLINKAGKTVQPTVAAFQRRHPTRMGQGPATI